MGFLNAIGSAYKAFDGAVAGGALPGGSDFNAGNLATEVAKDLLPGQRGYAAQQGSKAAKRGAAAADGISAGDAVAAVGSIHGGATGSRVRENIVESVRDKAAAKAATWGATKAGNKALAYATPVAGQGLMMYDTAKDGVDVYSAVLEHNTGEDLATHINKTRSKGQANDVIGELFPSASDYTPPEGPQEIVQGREDNWFDGINTRIRHAGDVFDPMQGEWGISELMYGR